MPLIPFLPFFIFVLFDFIVQWNSGSQKSTRKQSTKKGPKPSTWRFMERTTPPKRNSPHFLHKTHICMANKSPHRAGLFKRGLRQMKTQMQNFSQPARSDCVLNCGYILLFRVAKAWEPQRRKGIVEIVSLGTSGPTVCIDNTGIVRSLGASQERRRGPEGTTASATSRLSVYTLQAEKMPPYRRSWAERTRTQVHRLIAHA